LSFSSSYSVLPPASPSVVVGNQRHRGGELELPHLASLPQTTPKRDGTSAARASHHHHDDAPGFPQHQLLQHPARPLKSTHPVRPSQAANRHPQENPIAAPYLLAHACVLLLRVCACILLRMPMCPPNRVPTCASPSSNTAQYVSVHAPETIAPRLHGPRCGCGVKARTQRIGVRGREAEREHGCETVCTTPPAN